jgi:dTDP-glucose pyrophosphorylase
MKAVLLAGGLGTRFSEATDVRARPMIKIGAGMAYLIGQKIGSTSTPAQTGQTV